MFQRVATQATRIGSRHIACAAITPTMTTAVASLRLMSTAAATTAVPEQTEQPKKPATKMSWSKKLLIVGGAYVIGGGYVYATAKKEPDNDPEPFSLENFKQFKNLDDFKQNANIVLYQYETCPFCNKVRAFLDYHKIKYDIVEVNPLTKKEKKQNPDVARVAGVPILTINGHVLSDSTPIIKNINTILNYYRSSREQYQISAEEEAGLKFVDQRIIPLTAPNLYRTHAEALRSFNYIQENSRLAETNGQYILLATRYVGASIMYYISEFKLKKKYNITDPRKQLYEVIKEWTDGNKGAPFRGGATPNIADISCFGVMRALRNFDVGRDIFLARNTSQQFLDWYAKMEKIVED